MKVFDFLHQIDYISKDNKFVFIGKKIECTLVKREKGKIWDTLLIEDISKQELIERRKMSFKRREDHYTEYME